MSGSVLCLIHSNLPWFLISIDFPQSQLARFFIWKRNGGKYCFSSRSYIRVDLMKWQILFFSQNSCPPSLFHYITCEDIKNSIIQLTSDKQDYRNCRLTFRLSIRIWLKNDYQWINHVVGTFYRFGRMWDSKTPYKFTFLMYISKGTQNWKPCENVILIILRVGHG